MDLPVRLGLITWTIGTVLLYIMGWRTLGRTPQQRTETQRKSANLPSYHTMGEARNEHLHSLARDVVHSRNTEHALLTIGLFGTNVMFFYLIYAFKSSAWKSRIVLAGLVVALVSTPFYLWNYSPERSIAFLKTFLDVNGTAWLLFVVGVIAVDMFNTYQSKKQPVSFTTSTNAESYLQWEESTTTTEKM